MAEIIEKGNKLVSKCKYCGCIFSYTEDERQFPHGEIDPHGNRPKYIQKVKCPQCEILTPVKPPKAYNEKEG